MVTTQHPRDEVPRRREKITVTAQIALDLPENKEKVNCEAREAPLGENTRSVLLHSSMFDAVPQGSFSRMRGTLSCASAIHLLIGQIKGELSSCEP